MRFFGDEPTCAEASLASACWQEPEAAAAAAAASLYVLHVASSRRLLDAYMLVAKCVDDASHSALNIVHSFHLCL